MSIPEDARWRIERANRASVVVDADAYFRLARQAMMKAQKQILLVGWDFDARIRLAWENEPPGVPTEVGEFISWLVKRRPDLDVYILRWDKGAFKTLFRGKTLVTLTKWRLLRKRIHLVLDGHHPIGASQHQKIVVIDDCFAFCGGIDMTDERWDTRAHLDDDPHRKSPSGRKNMPWHDVTTALQGPVAAALGELCRARWEIAGGTPIAPPNARSDCWPSDLQPDFTDIDVAISRSQPAHATQQSLREIEHLYLALIARAKRHIYAESQYFASRVVAEAIARRLDEPDGPEIVIINPVTAQGWLEPIAMDTARARIFQALKQRDKYGRLRLYHPHTAGGTPIYVHAKVLVVDDEVIRIGSSNFNNRSLRLDTECDVTIEKGSADESARITAIRDDLIAEHLAVAPDVVTNAIAEHGLIGAIEALRGEGKTLVPYEVPDLSAVEEWLADNKILDPEGPDEMFEPLTKRRRLLDRLKRKRHRRVA